MTTASPGFSHNTQQHLGEILRDSLADSVVCFGGVQHLPADEFPAIEQFGDARLIVLTLSAFRFQGLVCLLAAADRATVALDDDYLKEIANNVCGTLKRQLGRHVPVLGMSTPNRLPLGCLGHLSNTLANTLANTQANTGDAGYSCVAVHGVDNRGIAFYANLLLCGSLELEPHDPDLAPDTTGELELF